MQIGYYPGCSLTGTAREFDKSMRMIAPVLDIELKEVADWNCCGATSAHATNRMLSLALPARVLAIAERDGLDRVLAPCAECYSRLRFAQVECREDEKLRRQISQIIDMDFKADAKAVSMIELLSEIGIEKIKSSVKIELKGLKVASYYGCLLVRPPKVVKFDDCEEPVTMDNAVKAMGADIIDWAFKTECCGASFSISKTDVVLDLTGKILRNARMQGADIVAVACPMCHSNLDMRQVDIMRKTGENLNIPILYITQLIGLALGMDAKELGLKDHFINAMNVMEKITASEAVENG
ncbi:MAG: CoB--CoM heterodisulfide reductase iron-sulfur subunit B family protein [Candidatus Omnitrophota bacterium]